MRFRTTIYVLGLITFTLTILQAQQVAEIESSDGDEETLMFAVESYGAPWILGDTDNDDIVDYALKLDENREKEREALDFNGDGMMDDFYFYSGGVLTREELDTNFDGQIDLWIYMHDGVRVSGYKRDTDFDGTIDKVREFGDS